MVDLVVPAKSKPGPKPKPLAERFWSRVQKTQTCWLWTGATDPHGYGIIMVWPNKSPSRAPRVAWELEVGAIPEGLCILHRCDTPGCVRPDHLFLGTRGDNVIDMVTKARWNTRPRGDGVRPVAFTSEHLRAIRVMLDAKMTKAAIARVLGVTYKRIKHLALGKTWLSAKGYERRKKHVIRGEEHDHAKLTAEQVVEIRRCRAAGEKLTSLASRFGVTGANISAIARRVTWRHVP